MGRFLFLVGWELVLEVGDLEVELEFIVDGVICMEENLLIMEVRWVGMVDLLV